MNGDQFNNQSIPWDTHWTGEERRARGMPTQQIMQSAFSGAIREVLADEKVTKAFWEAGYKQLQEHALNSGSQWIGKRMLTAIATALLAGILVYMLKTGQLK